MEKCKMEITLVRPNVGTHTFNANRYYNGLEMFA